MALFDKFVSGLAKTRENITAALKSFSKIDDELFDELEEALIMADMGVETSALVIGRLRERVKKERVNDAALVKDLLTQEISAILGVGDGWALSVPAVILVIGVNGVGKTTTIGKLAAGYKAEGKTVLLAAADTFRAAAIDQLVIWGERAGIDTIRHQERSDPGAVVFDAVQAAKARKTDVLICDTAGRLHNKKNLMDELGKIYKIIAANYPEARLESFLVLDATTGQNALQQAKVFQETARLTGLVLTKLDGTAKGGVAVAIRNEMDIPVRFVGTGEGLDDLQPFNPEEFARALFYETGS